MILVRRQAGLDNLHQMPDSVLAEISNRFWLSFPGRVTTRESWFSVAEIFGSRSGAYITSRRDVRDRPARERLRGDIGNVDGGTPFMAQ